MVVWPHGTEVLEEHPPRIEVPGYGEFALGDQVQIGGGYVLEHSEEVAPGPDDVAGIAVPTECAEPDIFLAH